MAGVRFHIAYAVVIGLGAFQLCVAVLDKVLDSQLSRSLRYGLIVGRFYFPLSTVSRSGSLIFIQPHSNLPRAKIDMIK